MDSRGNKIDSINEYYDAKDDHEDEYFPIESLTIENEWISNKETDNNNNITENNDMRESKGPSPYFENARMSSENIRFISPIQKTSDKSAIPQSNSSSPKINRSILNELLPTQVQFQSTESSPLENGEWQWMNNDKAFGIVFKICFGIWSVVSFLLLIYSKDSPIAGHENIKEIGGWFVCLLLLGLTITAVWARVLAEQTELVVYGLMMVVPTGFAFLGIYSLNHWYILPGILFISLSAIISAVLYFNRSTIRTTAEIVHNAAIFIQATPKVYSLLLKIVAMYVVFVWVWLKAFSRLFGTDWSIMTATLIQLSFVFMLIWTGAVLGTAQKFVIATWVRSWMNNTEDLADNSEIKVKLLDDESFGTVCLAASLLTLAKLTRLAAKGGQITIKAVDTLIPISGLFSWITVAISSAERFMQRFTDFAIYYSAVSEGDLGSFLESCKGLSRAVEGHLGLALTTDLTAQLLLTFSTILISSLSTGLILIIAKNHVSWRSGLIIGILAASVTDFVSTTYTAAIDSMFLCYVMDLKRSDRAGKIDAKIQSAFGPKLISAV